MSINLSKGQKISLEKEAGNKLTKVVMGLGWDVAKKKGGFLGFLSSTPDSVDLDASCVMWDSHRNIVDTVWFRQLKSKDGSIQHTGDNRTGAGDGDDEQIIVHLNQLPSNVTNLFFVVNSFTGQNFSQIDNAFCRIVDAHNNNEIAKYNLSCQGNHNAMVMCKLYYQNNEWQMHAIGENGSGSTFESLKPLMMKHL
ncbi:MAG: TerD family protein [Candidatus Sericytochromatia bacterium]